MIEKRAKHSCAKMEINGSVYVVVVGGYHRKTVELLNVSHARGQNWFKGPSLPENVHGASLLTSPTGKSVILIGGCSGRFNVSNKLFELSGDSTSNLKWHVMDQTLVNPRSSHLSHYLSFENTHYMENQYIHLKPNNQQALCF